VPKLGLRAVGYISFGFKGDIPQDQNPSSTDQNEEESKSND